MNDRMDEKKTRSGGEGERRRREEGSERERRREREREESERSRRAQQPRVGDVIYAYGGIRDSVRSAAASAISPTQSMEDTEYCTPYRGEPLNDKNSTITAFEVIPGSLPCSP